MNTDANCNWLQKEIFCLLVKCATDVPPDIEDALRCACCNEEPESPGRAVLETICENIRLARDMGTPLCQDTGAPVFYVTGPENMPVAGIGDAVSAAVREATAAGILRPNCVETLSGNNTGDNTGNGFSVIKTSVWNEAAVRIGLLLKGGGSENASGQYALPFMEIDAHRDAEGIRKTVLHHVVDVQGRGCAPGILGIGIGGDRETSYAVAKKQLFRRLDDVNPDPVLRDLENRLVKDINTLGIGPMGLGGKTTVIGVKIGSLFRHTACFFVSVSYLCWAARRYETIVRIPETGAAE